MEKDAGILIAGGGGFIGGWLARKFLDDGYTNIRSVDIKPTDQWYQHFTEVGNHVLDLRYYDACKAATKDMDYIFDLACDMGGMGFIENHKADCMLSVLINTNLLQAAREHGKIKRYLYTSSACVYNADKQTNPDVTALKEEDAYPAMPEDGYGWEKLFSERLCRHFREDYGIATRIVRLHNVYGPEGTWDGGREKAPAAISRKVIQAKKSGVPQIDIWGDGKQTRSFMYIDDCLKGLIDIMNSDIIEPINLGSAELVTINQLVDIVEAIAEVKLERTYNLDAPKGVRGRNSDNAMILDRLGWEPSTPLKDGMKVTYEWIHEQIDSGTIKT